jgi:chaperonin GroES
VAEEYEDEAIEEGLKVDSTLIQAINIAELLDGELLERIGNKVVDWYEADEDSRSDWLESNERWIKLTTQVMENKSYPWPNASNVKYPLLTTAAIQFHARAYPSLVNDAAPIKISVIGADDENQTKLKRANRVKTFMTFQLFEQMVDWNDGMDRLLFVLPILGMAYKKTYYSPARGRNVSELVLPQDLALNYHATDFVRSRKTHRMWMFSNEVREYQNQGIYLKVDLGEPSAKSNPGVLDLEQGLSPSEVDGDDPYQILECHCWWDFDGDGYKEPYIITVDHDSGKVLRIVARFSIDDVEYYEGDKVAKITPEETFTQYLFLPDPNSPMYGIGFGSTLGPINSAVNTVMNQLIDAGTLSNLGGGYLSRGMKMRGGAHRFTPGEWKQTQASGEEMRNGIFPLPIREPSMVLFNLLGTLIASGERVSSVTDIMVGENPGQNQPYSTTVAVLEQGQKVFVGIYKRIYRSLTEEYKKLFRLNGQYLDDSLYIHVIDDQNSSGNVSKADFNLKDFNIRPGADPSLVSEAQKLMKAESLAQKLAIGMPLNVQEVTRRLLEAEGHEDIQKLMDVPPPQPPLEAVLEMKKFEHQVEMDTQNAELEKIRTQFTALRDQAQAMLYIATANKTDDSSRIEQFKALMEVYRLGEEALDSRIKNMLQAKQIDDQAEQAEMGRESNAETKKQPE